MKKLFTTVLVLALVLSMSSFVMADNNDDPDAQLRVGIEISEYIEMGIVTDHFLSFRGDELKGLFNGFEDGTEIGQPGYYVSDGLATQEVAQLLFDKAGIAPVNNIDDDSVEMIVVAANTDVNLRMESDFAGWPNIPTFFRFSSNEGLGTGPGGGGNDYFQANELDVGSPLSEHNYNLARPGYLGGGNNELLIRGSITDPSYLDTARGTGTWRVNPATGVNWPLIQNFDLNDEFVIRDGRQVSDNVYLEFRECTPYLLHVNGALLIEKPTAVQAGSYGTIIDFIVEAADDNGNNS